jgi:four helix bundle protein
MMRSAPGVASCRHATTSNLALADAAEQLAAAVIRLSDRTPRLLHRTQLLKASQSVSSNIAEGFGRATLPDRNNRLVIARGETEETIRHLRANFAGKRITPAEYWRLHNRAVTIVKMLNSFLA